MDRLLRLVPPLPLVSEASGRFNAPRNTVSTWRQLTEEIHDETELDYCCSPVVLADRVGLDCVETSDCTQMEVIGDVIHYPPCQPFRIYGLGVLSSVARRLMLLAGLSVNDPGARWITAELALPRCVAVAVSMEDLPMVNPFVPVEFLRQIYLRHHDSGQFRALCTPPKIA